MRVLPSHSYYRGGADKDFFFFVFFFLLSAKKKKAPTRADASFRETTHAARVCAIAPRLIRGLR
jgi:hypothetical protein